MHPRIAALYICKILSIYLCCIVAAAPPTFAQIPIQYLTAPANVSDYQQCGANADARIVMMIDITSSITSADLTNERNAAKTLLNFFSGALIKPEVAIGTFNVSSDRARILPGASLTTAYGIDGTPGTGLYAALNNLTITGNQTDLASPISLAQGILANASGAAKPNFIVIISDGIPNRVPGDSGTCSLLGGCCGYTSAYNAAQNAATAAKNSSTATKIFAIHYGNNVGCAGEPNKGGAFLRDHIASDASYYFEGNADIAGVFALVSQQIVCNDNNNCTADNCNQSAHQCAYTDIGPDSDGDGINDCQDGCKNDRFKSAPGVCGCGFSDIDADSDGTPNCHDYCPNDPNKIVPGICNCGVADTDSDADGTPNCHDLCPNDPSKIAPGSCGCGIGETDSDGDGTPNCRDNCPLDSKKISVGICGCGVADTDTDRDGTPNCNDNCPSDPYKTAPGQCGCGAVETDNDRDGTANCNDLCPNDPLKTAPGLCGCASADTDNDHDGTPNCRDSCQNDPLKTVPGVCGCGVADTDSDHDGTLNCRDNCPSDPGKINPGICGCGVADTDSDLDGTPNCHDSCSSDSHKTSPGTCGCGVTDVDVDHDGQPDCQDQCPNDPNKMSPGICGCGIADTDTDGDGTANCSDQCPNDSTKTLPEACGCGTPDVDSDQDGHPDCQDQCPIDPNKSSPGACGCGEFEAADICGVCHGDGTTCLDCKGVPNGGAKIDVCGACGGDGRWCLNCIDSNVTDDLFALDSSALEQKKLVNKIVSRLKKVDGSNPKTLKFIAKTNYTANLLYQQNWTLTWSIPKINTQCTNTTLCTQSDNGPSIDSFNKNAKELRNLILQVVRALKRTKKARTSDLAFVAKAEQLYQKNLAISAVVPRLSSVCSK